jgi:CheY-like chemotaxis protein
VLLTSLGQHRDISPDGSQFAARLTKPVKASQLYDTLVRILTTQAAPAPAPAAPQFDPGMSQRYPLRILLAEDNPVNQKVALRLLEKMGYQADAAANGLQVLEALRQETYDVVLMDVHMPEMDGLEATQCIREQWPADGRPQIVALTANAMQGDRERYLAAGMDDYLGKPVRREELVEVLSRCRPLARPSQGPCEAVQISDGEPAASRSDAAAGRVPDRPAVDSATLEALQDTVGDVLLELIEIYLDNSSKLIANMRQAVEQPSPEALFNAAHALKSSSAMLGAGSLSALCQELETMGKAGALDDAPRKVGRLAAENERVKAELQAAACRLEQGE